MRTAIVCYDLKNVKSGDNRRVKEKLESFSDTFTTLQAPNINSLFLEWISFRLPDTTLYVSVSIPSLTAQQIANEVFRIIESVDAIPGKVFVAFITDYFILSAR
ncbi:hypothetical protein PQG02_00300 (plasmid) [Nostoc sp. UHCC 0926]|uniref:hypothetical protein n=1 Tax=Nostoc sp. UHCC 0926 TaxID=3025190 RepID=UPI00235F8D9D|nr:hypothetical protein [Nostoc sp. UHCC 0926]WDD30128.1 hypothetical protein PQG02_00300 [Nostoc sp. UHCC 0926]